VQDAYGFSDVVAAQCAFNTKTSGAALISNDPGTCNFAGTASSVCTPQALIDEDGVVTHKVPFALAV
jgi:hypothetical protein